jgi:tetratricopeptide (TPR) repeat protein
MTYVHPLWSDPPEPEDFRRAAGLLDRAAALPRQTAPERAYVEALRAYFQVGRQDGERSNLRAFARGWQQAQLRFPDDPEIRSFHALAVLSTADPDDKTYRVQRRSAAIAGPVLRRIPDHPGAHHYLIHASDYPPLAAEVLEVARGYGRIAPTVPHALHMPSHIFIRLGLWEEAITMNRRSADAALLHPVKGMTSLHYPHALDYLAYAHLQRGEDGRAEDVLRELTAIDEAVQPHIASAYALAAVQARLALERGDWGRAAGLRATTPPDFPWQRFPAMRAITSFARALGAARAGRPDQARREIDRLAGLRAEVAAGSDYWGKQVEIMEKSARAWFLHASGSRREGLALMREAAALETSTEKHPVTPGEVLPATELLGDMLLAEGRPADALRAYGQALERSPRRHNGLYGAGRAAERLGDRDTAARHYRTLLDATAAGAATEAVLHARRFLASRP